MVFVVGRSLRNVKHIKETYFLKMQLGGYLFIPGMLEKLYNMSKTIKDTGDKMLYDVKKKGKTFEESARERIPEGIRQLTSGKPYQYGFGVRRRRIKKKRVVKKRVVKKKKHGVYS